MLEAITADKQLCLHSVKVLLQLLKCSTFFILQARNLDEKRTVEEKEEQDEEEEEDEEEVAVGELESEDEEEYAEYEDEEEEEDAKKDKVMFRILRAIFFTRKVLNAEIFALRCQISFANFHLRLVRLLAQVFTSGKKPEILF